MDIRVFQTGRHYSEKGQRIAYTWDDNHIYFVDADRGIEGVFINICLLYTSDAADE